jgi:hypothetical protein
VKSEPPGLVLDCTATSSILSSALSILDIFLTCQASFIASDAVKFTSSAAAFSLEL